MPDAPRHEDVAHELHQVLADAAPRLADAWHIREQHHPPSIHFDRPIRTLPISLTGKHCVQQCAHCNGVYLKHMKPIWDANPDGASSCLISGGCDAQGRVPVAQHLDAVAALRPGRRLNWHVGMIDEAEIRAIERLVDVISFDVVGDVETVREVYGLEYTLDDYMATYDLLARHARVVPHVTIGLRGGHLSGERAALEALRARQPDRLVLIILIPTRGTAYADCAPPSLAEVTDLFIETRVSMPDCDLRLGCMRPYGSYRQAVDRLAVLAGLNGIVNPTRQAVVLAEERGLTIDRGDECCAFL